jgi:hypothetical protein
VASDVRWDWRYLAYALWLISVVALGNLHLEHYGEGSGENWHEATTTNISDGNHLVDENITSDSLTSRAFADRS